jgi:hypothetical protein
MSATKVDAAHSVRIDTKPLSSRERRFLFGFLLSGNASASYLAIVTQVGSQEEHAHQAASRMLGRIKRRINWPVLLERLDIGALNLVRELEKGLSVLHTAEGDGAALLLAEVLRSKAWTLMRTGPGTLAEQGDACRTTGEQVPAAESAGPGTPAEQSDASVDVCNKAPGPADAR